MKSTAAGFAHAGAHHEQHGDVIMPSFDRPAERLAGVDHARQQQEHDRADQDHVGREPG